MNGGAAPERSSLLRTIRLGPANAVRMMTVIRFLVLAIAAVAGASAVPAQAHVTAYAAGQGALNRIEVGIDVRASVQARCGFAEGGVPSGSVNQADFDTKGISKDFAIRLNCSGASRVAIRSQNGSLAHSSEVPGYASSAPYNVQLRLAGDDGTVATATCDAASLSGAGACAFSGTAGHATGLRLGAASTKDNGSYLRVSAPAYSGTQPLLAGDYSDTLTVTVSIAP